MAFRSSASSVLSESMLSNTLFLRTKWNRGAELWKPVTRRMSPRLNPLCKPSEVSYTLIPTMCDYEFLPVHRNNGFAHSPSVPKSLSEKEQKELVDLVDVKLGQEYELVVTTYSGLYRYRVGDVLRVTGFKNKAPQFNFICRKNVVPSIDSDKTDEVELQNAVKNAVNHLMPFDATLAEYTSYGDTSTIPGHYVLFWELSLNGSIPIPSLVFEDCCLNIEESLNSVYRQGRVSDNSIGPLEIKIVEPGTFDKLMDFAISLGASIDQYKAPRCVKYAPIVELMNSRIVSRQRKEQKEKNMGLTFSPDCSIACGHLEVSYTIMPNMAYFEFIPHEPNSARLVPDWTHKLVDLTDVEVGKDYELVVTTYAGLSKRQIPSRGDILRVTGFHNSAPQFHFVRRNSVLLSIDSDNTDEAELQKAIENATQLLREFNTSVVEYTSHAETKTIPGHYVIYWELLVNPDNSPSEGALNRCCLAMEESLNSVYRQGRVANNSIGPLEI